MTINGKKVKKIKVDGKEFMTGDTKTALKNLPTSVIDRIKAYDEKSDLSRVTGIDDGNEQTVLDFDIKRGMNQGLFSNIDLGIGKDQARMPSVAWAAYFKDKVRVMGLGICQQHQRPGILAEAAAVSVVGTRRTQLPPRCGALNFNYEDKESKSPTLRVA